MREITNTYMLDPSAPSSSPSSTPPSPSIPATPLSSSSSMSAPDNDAPDFNSVIIVGAGNFGAGTALSLARRGVQVTLLDTAMFPSPRAASHDINKIVRDDYPDLLYMRMMVKAMPMWRSDDLYKSFYHKTGMLRADPTNFAEGSIDAYKKLGIEHECEMLPIDEVRRRWNGIFATADFEDLDKVLFNPNVGIAEADKALAAVVQAGIDLGVEYVVGEMDTLAFGLDGQCIGVTLKSGSIFLADKVLMATGARTEPLLAQSAPKNKELHSGDRVLATGAVSFYAKLHGEKKARFASVPVLKNCLKSVKGEGMSILSDGTIKFNCDMCFTNFQDFPATGERMSLPPSDPKYNTWTGAEFVDFFKQRAQMTYKGIYGEEINDVEIESYRICWDASTPTHDFLITAHPHCDGLYVATGGSFHGWKFLPVIGDYIADMMQGTLDKDYTERWAWDKVGGDGHSANPTYLVAGDLQDWIA
ncbi:sarcosine oxidase [Cordyceps fumosorosea ARSEF 2679]|uniref:Sarcosine oxidase n=1 Tax=Cordyceps fumosorosea (strain ARSEF 2679) TaxID=1081104 RepID=A0A168BSR3_CORFA|nr:sarcosine oxidase [Cordyceps fumosorosea ARSEF 2679]OAA70500.1 sarcosine oxidase [Cordyceps fumosorosea ARSEF 2679]